MDAAHPTTSGDALPRGRRVCVDVAASSANLGPGFDALGLALGWRDEMTFEVSDTAGFDLSGVGADSVPRDGSHLVVRACRTGLERLGIRPPALHLTAHNTIPHGSGLGSSAAAVVAGAAAAWGLARPGTDPDPDWLLEATFDFEGHGDNLSASIRGGAVLAWHDGTARALALELHDDLRAVAYTIDRSVPTRAAREALPAAVPHADAAATAGRAALLVHALEHRPDLLWDATHDWLHQGYRADLMPESTALISRLRADRLAAFVSGAGPTVVVLGTAPELARCPEIGAFTRHELDIATGVRVRAEN